MKIEIEQVFHAFVEDSGLDIGLTCALPAGYEDAFGAFDITAGTLFLNRARIAAGVEYESLFCLYHRRLSRRRN